MASGTFTGQKSWCNDFILLKWKLTDNSLLTLDRVYYNTRLYCQHQVYTFMLPVWESLINMNMKRHTSTQAFETSLTTHVGPLGLAYILGRITIHSTAKDYNDSRDALDSEFVCLPTRSGMTNKERYWLKL